MRELNDLVSQVESSGARAVVIRSGKDGGFVAGADITEFGGFRDVEQAYRLVRTGQQVFDRIEALPIPTVAAIHGFALGGGLELALACDYRVGADDGKLNLGLPEVMLGVHPGFGGTVRTPQLIGAPAALDLMLTGKSLRAEEALKLGLVDRLVPREKLADAAREIALAPPPRRRPPFGTARPHLAVRALIRRGTGAQAGCEAREAGTLPGALRHPRPVRPARRLGPRPPMKPRRDRSRSCSSASSRETSFGSSSSRTA